LIADLSLPAGSLLRTPAVEANVIRVALITGCGKTPGIGSATARALARAGCAVAVSDIVPAGVANDLGGDSNTGTGIDGLVREIVDGGGSALAVLHAPPAGEGDQDQLLPLIPRSQFFGYFAAVHFRHP